MHGPAMDKAPQKLTVGEAISFVGIAGRWFFVGGALPPGLVLGAPTFALGLFNAARENTRGQLKFVRAEVHPS